MRILSLETSCDETSAAIVDNGRIVLSNVISSQIKIHRRFNGVVPELASRAHLENINSVASEAFLQAGLDITRDLKNISAIAFTKGPGLAGSLLVGAVYAASLAQLSGKPLIGINHIEGHLYSAIIENKPLKPPFLSLIVSGGHTELIIVKDFGRYIYLGGTRDDAAGEAFDKAARILGLPYPGGPAIDKMSAKAKGRFSFPRPLLPGSWDFSFSGIKTHLFYFIRNNPKLLKEPSFVADACATFQDSIVETLIIKALAAAEKFNLKCIALGGGVAANSLLRKALFKSAVTKNIKVYLPSPVLCTDNAAMIACAAYFKYVKLKNKCYSTGKEVLTEPSLKLSNWVSHSKEK